MPEAKATSPAPKGKATSPAPKGKTKSVEKETPAEPAAARAGTESEEAEGAAKQRKQAAAAGKAAATAASVADVEQALYGGYETLAEIGTENMKAVVAAGTILVKGVEALGREVTTYARDSITAGVDVVRDLSECENPADAFDQQSAFARTSFEGFVAETEKLSDMSVKVTREALEPINTRIAATTDTLLKGPAA
jgi:phasin family protein